MLRARFATLFVLFLVASLAAILLWRSPSQVQAQGGYEPLCDVTCGPDPDSPTYAGTVTARPKLPNARGLSTIAPRVPPLPGPRPKPEANHLPGSESYQHASQILYLPGRNGLDLNLTLHYNSRLWTHDSVNATMTFNADRDFPSYGFRLGFGYIELDSEGGTYILTEPDGSKRQLVFVTTNSYDSSDTSYINYNPSTKVLIYKNGTRVSYQDFPSQPGQLFRPTLIKDTNGNFITITYRTEANRDQHINTITDTLGRVVTFNYLSDGRLDNITQGARIHAIFTWNLSYVLNYNFSPSLTVGNTSASGSTHKVLTGCIYNNATSYNFIYGDWGIVKKIERKSASSLVRNYVSYNFQSSAIQLSEHPSWTQETVFDGTTSVITNYSVTKVGGQVSTYTVTDPGGTKAVTTLNTSGTYTGLVSKVEIKDAVNTVLRKMDNVWISDTGGRNPRLSTVTSTLSDTGQQSKVELTYTTFGNVSEVKEYDYGLVLTRRTATTYLTTSSYTTNTRHILDRPTQVLVKTGANAIKARTDFAYDLTSPSGLTPAPVNHDTAGYGASFNVRGNVTRITRYSNAAAGTGSFLRNFAYDIAGNLRTADLDCCTTKTWLYDSTTQYAYPVTVTSGPVGMQLTTSALYNFASGTVASSTDENGKTTNYGYDAVDRPATVTLPNGVVLTTANDDASLQPSVTQSGSANSAVQFTKSDGLGRVILGELRNGATVVSTTETQYDSVGRPFQTSNPYAPSETKLWTVTTYDALSRALTVTPPGAGGFYQYAYSGNVVTITDPAGKQRRNTSDALGRLVKVEEPGFGDGLPGKGSVAISGFIQFTTVEECDDFPPFLCHTIITGYDSGSVSITVNGSTKSVNYGQSSTASNLATALANAINADSGYPVNAGVTGGTTINLTAKTVGVSTNYSLSASSQTNDPATYGGPSFTATRSGPTLTGGWNPSGPDTATLVTPMPTTYTYDVLDNLLTVAQAQGWPQGGITAPPQNRTYNYDSLSRLTSTVTPESATTSFYYTTAAGGTCSYDPTNLCRRTDARSITSTYSYDGLGRLGGVTYSDGTPTVTYTYGTSSASNNNGRLITLADGAGTESYTYDLMGRITNVAKVISGVTYNLVYAYNNANQLTSLTYPSGKVVTQAYDAIGRTSSIASGATTYLSGVSFNAAGQPLAFNYGNGVAATFSYNQRLQLASLRYVNGATDLLNLAYAYGAANNGQIKDVKYYTSPGVEDQAKSQNYEYDAWARLRRAYTTNLTAANTWRLEWDYDRFGNRKNQNLTGGNTSVTAPQLSISETTNRITTAGYVYDAAGNMTNDSLHAYTFDAENRIKTVDSTAATYTYSGPLRVKKVQGTTTTVYIFSGTKVIAEYANGALSKEYVYSGSALLATHEGATLRYHHRDHLGTRVDSDTAGNWTRKFAHFPFGESWYEDLQGGGVASKLKFTSYERDSESGLDQAMFRYDSPRLGRFMSPDLLAGSAADPQSMNRYAYVRNDPVNFADPLGLSHCTPPLRHNIVTGQCEMPNPGPDDPPPPPPGPGPGNSGYSAEYGSCHSFRINGVCWDRFLIAFLIGVGEGVEDHPPRDYSRDLQALFAQEDCAKLAGGKEKAQGLAKNLKVIDVTTDSFKALYAEDIIMREAIVTGGYVAGTFPEPRAQGRVWVGSTFNQLPLAQQLTVLIHEVGHQAGRATPKTPDGRKEDLDRDNLEITKACGTAPVPPIH